jgi:hypothetical protein
MARDDTRFRGSSAQRVPHPDWHRVIPVARPRSTGKWLGLPVLALLALARCAAPGPHATPAATRAPLPAPAPGAFAPPTVALDENGKPILFNDPSAPPDTPLCGREAQEANAIGDAVQGARVAASGVCAAFACYDPLTATYIGADGYRHVCR